jgi:exopolysaccharide production protein ExoQ
LDGAEYQKASVRSLGSHRRRSSVSTIDKYAIVPILACVFATIVDPVNVFLSPVATSIQSAEPGLLNRLFWPAMAAVSVFLAVRNQSRLSRLHVPPHIVCLIIYAGFAGASALWAFKPPTSFARFAQQIMVITSIVLPALMAARTVDLMRWVFLCFTLAALVNIYFLSYNAPLSVQHLGGYQGYFLGKNYLGEFAAPALLLALHQIVSFGGRRILGVIAAIAAIALLILSNSKTAFALAFISPIVASAALLIRKHARVSIAIILLSVPVGYTIVNSILPNINTNRLSYMMYGDSTFTGRTIIWDFAQKEIDRSPLIGWGYQSFWLVGADGPSMSAPGFVKDMPNAHNGYYDTKLELGYIGFALLVAFILSTLHAIGRVADRDPARARLLLSLALFVIIYNCLESLWMRGYEFLWVLFLLLAADIARHWQPSPQMSTQVRPARRRRAALCSTSGNWTHLRS